MRKTDRFLIGIVTGIVILVIVALVVALRRPEETYRTDDTPAAVVHNYLLALHRQDYARAHSYLSPTLPGYPKTVEAFTSTVLAHSWSFGQDQESVGFTIRDTRQPLPDQATVIVEERHFSRSGLLGSNEWSQQFTMRLVRVDGAWRLTGSESYRYWVACWNDSKGCTN